LIALLIALYLLMFAVMVLDISQRRGSER
jgi:hypothetical protein